MYVYFNKALKNEFQKSLKCCQYLPFYGANITGTFRKFLDFFIGFNVIEQSFTMFGGSQDFILKMATKININRIYTNFIKNGIPLIFDNPLPDHLIAFALPQQNWEILYRVWPV